MASWGIWALTVFVVIFNIYVGTAVMQLKEEIASMRKALLKTTPGISDNTDTSKTNEANKGEKRGKGENLGPDIPKPRIRRVRPRSSDDEFE